MPGNDSKSSGAQSRRIKRPLPIKVYVSENAFMGLLISSAEVFRNESLGYLLGYRLDDRYIVEYAFGLQTAKRRRRGVMLNNRNQKRIEPILSNFEKLQIVGDFHSHTEYGGKKGKPIPSPEDIQEMERDNLYIIVAINELKRSRSWKENRDGSISGSMGNFFFKVSAYLSPFVKGVPQKAPIFCPFPPGLKVG
ncbi:MAG: Mov34/MPN/PAD-1 family protein [Nitrospirota bacterium]